MACDARIAVVGAVVEVAAFPEIEPVALPMFGVVKTGETVVGITVPVPLNVYTEATLDESNPASVDSVHV